MRAKIEYTIILSFILLMLCSVCHAQVVIGGAPGIGVPVCAKTDDQAASATTITQSVTVTGGSGHVLYAFMRGGSGNPFTIADNSGSNTWVTVSLSNSVTAGTLGSAYVQNPAAGTYTVTGTYNGSTPNRSITVCELSGLLSSNALDSGSVSAQNSSCASGTSCTTATFSTASAHEFIIVFVTVNSTSDVFTAGLIGGTSSTLLSPVANDSAGEYLNVTSTQTNITAAISGTGTVNWGYIVAAFKAP